MFLGVSSIIIIFLFMLVIKFNFLTSLKSYKFEILMSVIFSAPLIRVLYLLGVGPITRFMALFLIVSIIFSFRKYIIPRLLNTGFVQVIIYACLFVENFILTSQFLIPILLPLVPPLIGIIVFEGWFDWILPLVVSFSFSRSIIRILFELSDNMDDLLDQGEEILSQGFTWALVVSKQRKKVGDLYGQSVENRLEQINANFNFVGVQKRYVSSIARTVTKKLGEQSQAVKKGAKAVQEQVSEALKSTGERAGSFVKSATETAASNKDGISAAKEIATIVGVGVTTAATVSHLAKKNEESDSTIAVNHKREELLDLKIESKKLQIQEQLDSAVAQPSQTSSSVLPQVEAPIVKEEEIAKTVKKVVDEVEENLKVKAPSLCKSLFSSLDLDFIDRFFF